MRLTESRFDLAVRALHMALELTHPTDAVLRHFFRETHMGQEARTLVAETVFGVLRHRLFLEQACQLDHQHPITARRLALCWWVRFGGYSLRELAPLLRQDEEAWLGKAKAFRVEELPLPIQAELPLWIIDKLRPHHDDAFILALGRALQQSAPLDLRVNTIKASRNEVLQALLAEGIPAGPTPFSPVGIRLHGKPALNQHPLFLSGKIEVQDEGSQLLALLLAPRRTDMVVDFCAGAGGKTLMLGALMHSQGRLYAWDVSGKRLAKLKPRLARSGLSNVHPQLIAHEHDARIKRLAGKIDRVLVDVPCSGLGTLRRNPDLKFRQSPASVSELVSKQMAILASAARLVRPGGRLIYATCSLLHEENRQVVENFLATTSAFHLVPAGAALAQQKIGLAMEDYLTLYPHLHNTDGFFAAILERNTS